VWLAKGRAAGDPVPIARALALLAEQGRAAAALGLGWLRLKVMALEALGHAALRHNARALALLGEAVVGAEPEGHVRLFADEGPPMAALLARLRTAPPEMSPAVGAYVDRLLGALAAPGVTVVNREDGDAVLSGPIRDQAALMAVLRRVHDLGLTLVAVRRTPAAADRPASDAPSADP
jgi:hypothetical protein